MHTANSSSADDYRSVIDDLTVEIQRLREELKRYKRTDPDMLRKDKLFEIKIHGLPSKKKRELEATLQDFASNLDRSPRDSLSKKKPSHNVYSGFGSQSKHASSSSGSNIPPTDSAYASMSNGARSSATPISRPNLSSMKSSEQKTATPLREIPEGLYPRQTIMTEKERKKMVVRRLEQLFTGKIGGRAVLKQPITQPGGGSTPPATLRDVQMTGQPSTPGLANPLGGVSRHFEAPHQDPGNTLSREAMIEPLERQYGGSGRQKARGFSSASNFDEEMTESGGNTNSSGLANDLSPTMPPPPEQRPTRPRDLDPDRAQILTENMDYIKHLGLVPQKLLHEQQMSQDAHQDAEGWVYLNLLCSLAQLHMINVTPDFVRSAVSEISTKFQLSPDGRRIRWRGGSDGTKFSSDSSASGSQRSSSADDIDAPKKKRKRQKTSRSARTGCQSGSSSKYASQFDPQLSGTSESFHYKPLFIQHHSNQSPSDETVSSFGPAEDDKSRWGMDGSGNSNRRKRRHDGTIIYYSGAPFCTDLSGDSGDMSPATHMLSAEQYQQKHWPPAPCTPSPPCRTLSGTLIKDRPLSDRGYILSAMDVDDEPLGLTENDSAEMSDVELDFVWTDEPQFMEYQPLEPCGLGGILPDDHFMVVVATKRPKQDHPVSLLDAPEKRCFESADGIVRKLATMPASYPRLGDMNKLVSKNRLASEGPSPVEVEYLSGRIKRLATAPLPPPTIFFPPFSTDTSLFGETEDTSMDDEEAWSSDQSTGQIAPVCSQHHPDSYPDDADLSSGDEEGADPDESSGEQNMYDAEAEGPVQGLPSRARVGRRSSSAAAAAGTTRGAIKNTTTRIDASSDDTSVAVTDAGKSGYSTSEEDSG